MNHIKFYVNILCGKPQIRRNFRIVDDVVYYLKKVNHHYLVYRIINEEIYIYRILHEKMDFERHLE